MKVFCLIVCIYFIFKYDRFLIMWISMGMICNLREFIFYKYFSEDNKIFKLIKWYGFYGYWGNDGVNNCVIRE